jgi:molybdopterin adenylyltransferase
MTDAPPNPALIGILTVSDRASRGVYADEGGPAIRGYLHEVLASPWEPRERIVPASTSLTIPPRQSITP